jgi:hypothetical protein
MAILKPVLMLAILSSVMVCSNAWATERPPRIGATAPVANPETKADTKADAKVAPQTEAKPAANTSGKKPAKRRAVRQILDDTPPPVVYSPRLNPAVPVGVQPLPAPVPASPHILNGCNGGACTDASGARYHGGVGTTLLSPEGRMCSNNGVTVQCF